MTFDLDHIEVTGLYPLGESGDYRLHFRSSHSGWLHQLYADGELIDSTDSAAQMFFDVPTNDAARCLEIAAVTPDSQHTDFSREAGFSISPWIFKAWVIRKLQYRPGDQIHFFHDDASGEMLLNPSLSLDIWPSDCFHWGFGRDAFGGGGFGFDGMGGMGFGVASFGAGPLGFGGEALRILLSLTQCGQHRIQWFIQNSALEKSAVTEVSFNAEPPPPSPAITITEVDSETIQLTLEAQG